MKWFRCSQCKETYEIAFKRGTICLCCRKENRWEEEQKAKKLKESKKGYNL